MIDQETSEVHQLIDQIETDRLEAKSMLASEVSFRKVYAATGILLFLYGMMYGAWFASK